MISDDVTINGDTNGDGTADVTINGGELANDGGGSGNNPMFNVSSGNATFGSLTFYGGQNSYGIDIDAGGMARVENSSFFANFNYYGGAIANRGTAQVIGSTFANNSANTGGAIYNTGTLDVLNSTFYDNQATDDTFGGGAIYSSGSATVTNSTITGNYAIGIGEGGGILNNGGSLSLNNSIVAGNAGGGNDIQGTVTSNGANIFGSNVTGSTVDDLILGNGFDVDDIFDQTGSVIPGVSITSGLLGSNGGPVDTVALLANAANPALDAAGLITESDIGVDFNGDGDVHDDVDTDARGFNRTVDLTGVNNEGMFFADIGAFETQDVPTEGPDYIVGGTGANTINGLGGNDFIDGGGGADTLIGGDGDDTLVGNSGNDVLRGEAGADDLQGGANIDHAVYNNSDAAVTVNLAAGTGLGGHAEGDTLSDIERVTGSNIFGDKLFGNAQDNLLRGNGGDDILRGEGGADDLNGGAGSDWSVYINSDAAVEVNLATGTGVGGHAQGDTLSGIEKLSGSNGFGDKLFGDAADNTLRGNGGDDTLRGEAGADILQGGSGSDFAVYINSDAAVEVNLTTGTGVGGHAEGDTLSGIEKLSGSNGFGDRLIGNAQDNLLRGNGGDDTLRGEAGADILNGGAGSDWAVYINSDDAVEVDLAAGTGVGGHAEGDTLSGIEKLSGSNGFGDRLYGDGADNTLRGNGGNDILRGDAGADILQGGSGVDHAIYNNSDAAVEVDLAAGTGLGGHAEGDTLSSIERVTGSNGFGDKLFGNAADNTLRGNGGDDVLRGNEGADILNGGSGSDFAVYINSDAAVEVDLAAGTGVGGHAQGDTLSGIEKLSGSNGFGDKLFGDAADNPPAWQRR